VWALVERPRAATSASTFGNTRRWICHRSLAAPLAKDEGNLDDRLRKLGCVLVVVAVVRL